MSNSKLKWFALAYLLVGAAGAALHQAIYRLALDSRELIVPCNVYGIVLWVLTGAAVLGAGWLSTRFTVKANGNPPVLGSIVYALGIYTLTVSVAKGPAPLVLVYRVVGYAALVSLVLSAVLGLMKKPQAFLLDVCPCVLTILHLVECYQLWSEVPQLTDYVYSLGAVVCIMLFVYHKMALRAKLPASKVYVFAGLCGIYFCCIGAMQSDFPYYFLSAALWMGGMFFAAQDTAEV